MKTENQNENHNQNNQVMNIVSSIAESNIEPQELINRLQTVLDTAQLSEAYGNTAFDDIDRLRVSSVTAAIAKKLQELYKAGAKDEYIRTYGRVTGDQLHHNGRVRLYETTSYTWENVHIDDDELRLRNDLFHEITAIEETLKIKKAKLKGYDEALGVRFPNSGAIHKKQIISIL